MWRDTLSPRDPAFPVVEGPDLTFSGGTHDGFIAKVNASGSKLVYCGYIGGGGWDERATASLWTHGGMPM